MAAFINSPNDLMPGNGGRPLLQKKRLRNLVQIHYTELLSLHHLLADTFTGTHTVLLLNRCLDKLLV